LFDGGYCRDAVLCGPRSAQGRVSEFLRYLESWIILYILLSGYPPFEGTEPAQIFLKVRKGIYCFPHEDWKTVSNQAKYLIQNMLKKDTKLRYTAEQCLEDPWFKILETGETLDLDRTIVKRLKFFKKPSRLKQEILKVVVKFSSLEDREYLTNNFRALDLGGSGLISSRDIQNGAEEYGISMTESEAHSIMNRVDFGMDGQMDYSEFLNATVDGFNDDLLKFIFSYFDLEKKGFITQNSLDTIFKREAKQFSKKEIKKMIKEVDLDKDGKINYEEFRTLMK
jgi:calcium-dependent protein kinase